MAKSKIYGITGKQAARIRRTCERVEGTPPNRPFGDGSGGKFWNPGILRAKVTTAIPTGTFAAPSSAGRIQIYERDHDGSWVESGDPVEVRNDNVLTASIPVGRSVKVGWIAGEWWLVSASCS